MNNNETIFVCGLSFCVGIGCLIFSGMKERKIASMADKLGTTIDNLSAATSVDISDKVIEKAVSDAVNREVGSKIDDAASKAVDNVRNDILSQVKKAVDKAYDSVEDGVKEELTKKVGDVSIERIRREVVEEAKKEAKAKFSNDLDDILVKHNEELASVTKVYGNIANALSSFNSNNSGNGLKLTLG